jgi:hypothetical protein
MVARDSGVRSPSNDGPDGTAVLPQKVSTPNRNRESVTFPKDLDMGVKGLWVVRGLRTQVLAPKANAVCERWGQPCAESVWTSSFRSRAPLKNDRRRVGESLSQPRPADILLHGVLEFSGIQPETVFRPAANRHKLALPGHGIREERRCSAE